jgi:hypothetical protein
MSSITAKKAATEALRRRARESLARRQDAPTPPPPTPPTDWAAACRPPSAFAGPGQVPMPAPQLPAPPVPPPALVTRSSLTGRPDKNPNGTWTYRTENYLRGHDAWAAFRGPRKAAGTPLA